MIIFNRNTLYNKITFLEPYDSDEPVVALCQGCTGNGGDFTTSKPEPETTTTGINPGTTTTQNQGDDCCQKVTLESSGGIQQHYHEALGNYSDPPPNLNRPFCKTCKVKHVLILFLLAN